MDRDDLAGILFGAALCALGVFILVGDNLSARMCGGGKGCSSGLAIGLSCLGLGLYFFLAPFYRAVSRWYSDLEPVKAKRDAEERAELAAQDERVLKAWGERSASMKIVRPKAPPKRDRKRPK